MTDKEFRLKKTIRENFILNVAQEYKRKHMSGNLVQSMRRRTIKKHGIVSIYIYAPRYDIWKYWYDKTIIPTGTGSYAEDNDAVSGGLKRGKDAKSGYVLVDQLKPDAKRLKMLPTYNHINFVERNIEPAIIDALAFHGIKNYEIKKRGR